MAKNKQWGKYRKKKIIRRWFGNLMIEPVAESLEDPRIKHLITNHEHYGKEIEIRLAEFENGGLSISIYDPETKIGYKIASATPSMVR